VQVDDPRVEWLVEVFKDLRQDDGLTTEKLRKHPELVVLLVNDGTAEAAKDELEKIVLSMGDSYKVRALRNSLVISNGRDGIEARGGPEERRKWATGANEPSKRDEDRLIPRTLRTHPNYEDEKFIELANLIIDRADRRAHERSTVESPRQLVVPGTVNELPEVSSPPTQSKPTSTSSKPPRRRLRRPVISKRLKVVWLSLSAIAVAGIVASSIHPVDTSGFFDTEDFLQCRDVSGGTWLREINAQDNHRYECFLRLDYAKPPSRSGPQSSAMVELPAPGLRLSLVASIGDAGATSYDSMCRFISKDKAVLNYVRGSAHIYGHNLTKDGQALPESPQSLPFIYGLTVNPGVDLPVAGQQDDYLLFDVTVNAAA
jgi:hypothetical protein